MAEVNPTKQMIFDAIERIITEQGLEAVTFSELSRRCFIQPSGIVYYFKSKSNMLREFFEYIMDRPPSAFAFEAQDFAQPQDAVRAFCDMVDAILFSRSYSNPLSAALLRSAFSDLDGENMTRELVLSSLNASIASVIQQLFLLKEQGIFEESRFSANVSCFVYAVLGCQYSGYIQHDIPQPLQSLLSPELLAQHIKRSFLKDGTPLRED